MYAIEIMEAEHENICWFTEYLRAEAAAIVRGEAIHPQRLLECVDFARHYSDQQHHGKEEKFLFNLLLDKKLPVADKLVRNGMLVEHDLARSHVRSLEEAAKAYARLLDPDAYPDEKQEGLATFASNMGGAAEGPDYKAAEKLTEEGKEMSLKLDILTHMLGYADLLQLHAFKENAVVYPFAERTLSEEEWTDVNAKTKRFEEETMAQGVQDHYVSWLTACAAERNVPKPE